MPARTTWWAFVIAAVLIVTVLAAGGTAPAQDRWATYHNARFGTTADYPADLFTVRAPPPANADGQTFRTADGRAQLLIYGTRNIEEDSPASYVEKYFDKPDVSYKRATKSFFVVSGLRDGEIFYSRCNFPTEADGIIHCLSLSYPAKEKAAWDSIVTRISRSLRSDEDAERR